MKHLLTRLENFCFSYVLTNLKPARRPLLPATPEAHTGHLPRVVIQIAGLVLFIDYDVEIWVQLCLTWKQQRFVLAQWNMAKADGMLPKEDGRVVSTVQVHDDADLTIDD